jgi:hypothetical protein
MILEAKAIEGSRIGGLGFNPKIYLIIYYVSFTQIKSPHSLALSSHHLYTFSIHKDRLDVVWPKVCGKVNTWPYINEITQHAKEIRHITTYHRS